MSSQVYAPTPLRQRQASSAGDDVSRKTTRQYKTKAPEELIKEHPAIKPMVPLTSSTETTKVTSAYSSTSKALTIVKPSLASRLVSLLMKPVYFLPFAVFHVGLELLLSAKTMKTYFQVFFMPFQFPAAPEVARVLRKDLGTDLAKKPKHLAVILPQDSTTTSEEQEEEWHAEVAQLVQWSLACDIECLSIMRTDPLPKQWLNLLQERIDDSLEDFFREEKTIPVARVRTLNRVEDNLKIAIEYRDAAKVETQEERQIRLHGRTVDLDVVILAENDGHDRLASSVRVLGEAALQKEIQSKDITAEFMDQQLSADLSEPDLLIIYKDELDLSSYPPWHIRLTEIFHHPDQAVIPHYTLFLQALHRFAKCEQRYGK